VSTSIRGGFESTEGETLCPCELPHRDLARNGEPASFGHSKIPACELLVLIYVSASSTMDSFQL